MDIGPQMADHGIGHEYDDTTTTPDNVARCSKTHAVGLKEMLAATINLSSHETYAVCVC